MSIKRLFKILFGILVISTISVSSASAETLLFRSELTLSEKPSNAVEVLPEENYSVSMLSLNVSDYEETSHLSREFISELDNSEVLLYAYDKIADGIKNKASYISLSSNGYTVTISQAGTAFYALYNDYPEFFYITNGYRYSYNSDIMLGIHPEYIMDVINQESLFESSAQAIIDSCGITSDMSEYERALKLHDALCAHITYDKSGDDFKKHTAYGAIVEKKAVCDGYAKAYQYLLNKVGISSSMVTGYSFNPSSGETEGHAWNLLKIDDEYYHCDITWDDQGEDLFYMFFNVTTEQIQNDHYIDTSEYSIPECTATAANYFANNPQVVMDNPDQDEIVNQLKYSKYARIYSENKTVFTQWFIENYANIAALSGINDYYMWGYTILGNEIHLKIIPVVVQASVFIDTKPTVGQPIPTDWSEYIYTAEKTYQFNNATLVYKTSKDGEWIEVTKENHPDMVYIDGYIYNLDISLKTVGKYEFYEDCIPVVNNKLPGISNINAYISNMTITYAFSTAPDFYIEAYDKDTEHTVYVTANEGTFYLIQALYDSNGRFITSQTANPKFEVSHTMAGTFPPPDVSFSTIKYFLMGSTTNMEIKCASASAEF